MSPLASKPFLSSGLIVLAFLVTGCDGSNGTDGISPLTPPNPSISVPPSSSLTTTAPPTIVTPSTADPTWVPIANGPIANQVRALLVDQSGDLWTGGPGGLVHWDSGTGKPTTYAVSANPENTNVVALNQAPDNAIWVGTFENGVAKFDGASWQSFTTENGLLGAHIISQTVSPNGDLWLNTKKATDDSDPDQEFHFERFDGNRWTKEVGGGFSWIGGLADGSIVGARGDTGIAKHDSVIGIYDGQRWTDLGLIGQSITAVTVAPNGVIWVATEGDVFLYVEGAWKRLTPPWAAKDSASVSSIAVQDDGTAWFGSSFGAGDFDKCGLRMDYAKEWGVFRYDGHDWTRFTEEAGLADNKICTITLDESGNVWFGSFDRGVSRFDGQEWKTYAVP